MSRNDAQAIINDWFRAMPKVEEYIKRQRKAARNGERQQTMFGRVRHYTLTDENGFHVENEYINTPIQSMVLEVKDNDELVREVAQHCQQVMHDVPERMIPNCPLPFKADIEVGYSWGKLEEPEW